jgi:hypothetical protein
MIIGKLNRQLVINVVFCAEGKGGQVQLTMRNENQKCTCPLFSPFFLTSISL